MVEHSPKILSSEEKATTTTTITTTTARQATVLASEEAFWQQYSVDGHGFEPFCSHQSKLFLSSSALSSSADHL